MPRPRSTPARLQAMRQRILDAAFTILLEKGLQGLSSRAIADELGMAHMALYTYFENQSAILEALAEREMAKIRPQLEMFERRAAEGEDIAAVMRAALAFYPQFEQAHPQVFRLAWVMPQQDPGNMEQARSRTQYHVEFLARLVRLGIERGVFEDRDPFLAAAAVFGMVTFPLVLFHTGRIADPFLRDQLVGEMLEAAMRYLYPTPLQSISPEKEA